MSKLLLRYGIVCYSGQAWTGRLDAWLRRQHLRMPAARLAFDCDYDAVLTVAARRNRLDKAITAVAAESEFTKVTRQLGCLRGISTLTGFALAVEVGDWSRFAGASIGSYVGLVPAESPQAPPGSRAGSPRPETGTPAGCWSRPPGTTSPGIPSGRRCASGETWHPPPRGPRRRRKPASAPAVGPVQRSGQAPRGRQRRRRPRAGRPVLVPGRYGGLTPKTARLRRGWRQRVE